MKHGMVECRECRFWVPYTEDEGERTPGLEDIGLCHQFRSSNWLMRMYKDQYCGHGQLRRD